MHVLPLKTTNSRTRLDVPRGDTFIINAIGTNIYATVLAMVKHVPVTGIEGKQAYGEEDIERMEKQTLEKANRALSVIENTLAIWDASKEKPEDLRPRISRLKYFYEALAGWEKRVLTAKNEDIDTRIGHLREFSDICHAYA
jgi:hypothetical protein